MNRSDAAARLAGSHFIAGTELGGNRLANVHSPSIDDLLQYKASLIASTERRNGRSADPAAIRAKLEKLLAEGKRVNYRNRSGGLVTRSPRTAELLAAADAELARRKKIAAPASPPQPTGARRRRSGDPAPASTHAARLHPGARKR